LYIKLYMYFLVYFSIQLPSKMKYLVVCTISFLTHTDNGIKIKGKVNGTKEQ